MDDTPEHAALPPGTALDAAIAGTCRAGAHFHERAVATAGCLYTRSEEIANWLTHGIGALLSAAACTLLLLVAHTRGDGWHLVSFAIFGVSLLAQYTISTLYHAAATQRRREFLQRLDHAAIFLLIAGTYTPFLLTRLRGPWGWSLLAIIWILCSGGAVYKLLRGERDEIASTLTYLFVAWLIVIAIKPLITLVPSPALLFLFGGGAFYTAGVAFYLWHRLRFHHAIWHAFVLGGSACHCLAVFYLAPAR